MWLQNTLQRPSTSCALSSLLEARFSATIEALVSDHLGNSKAVAYESFRNSLIIHKEKTKEINVYLVSV